MEKKQLLLIPAFALLIVGVFVLASINNNSVSSNNVGDSIGYHSSVCKQVTRADGAVEPVECSSNVLYDTGGELIEAAMGNEATADAADNITLCNATAGCGTPVVGSGEDYTEYTSCGLEPVTGTYTSLGTNANWTISHEFTASCDDLLTNVTHLHNGAGDEFAGNSFTLVTLQTDDKLTLNWTVWVT